jgi:lysophospholipase L1-like esterase
MKRFPGHAWLMFVLIIAPVLKAQEKDTHWIGTWAAAPVGMRFNPGQIAPGDSTYRDIVHVSEGGTAVRVQLTNEFGSGPLMIGAAHIALSDGPGDNAIESGSDHALTFSGQDSIMIPAGAFVYSDPVPLKVAAMANLAVSVYLPKQEIAKITCHGDAQSTNFIAPGDEADAETLTGSRPIYSWCFVKGIDVTPEASDAGTIVAFGDSITDGWQSTRDGNNRWTDVLAQRLQDDPKTKNLAVINEGIGGNRLLHDGAGPNALARFDRDVLAQSGVKYVIILEGINDIGHTIKPLEPGDQVTDAQIEFALSQLVARAHEHGLKVFGATLTPYVGAKYEAPAGEKMREAENEWIRTSGVFDEVIDFDKATRDPANPLIFAPSMDSGDHLHPNPEGYKAMGSAIDLSMFH